MAGRLDRAPPAARQGRLALTDWLEHWLRTEGVAWEPVTRHERADRIDKLIVPHLGGLRLTEISRGARGRVPRRGRLPQSVVNLTPAEALLRGERIR